MFYFWWFQWSRRIASVGSRLFPVIHEWTATLQVLQIWISHGTVSLMCRHDWEEHEKAVNFSWEWFPLGRYLFRRCNLSHVILLFQCLYCLLLNFQSWGHELTFPKTVYLDLFFSSLCQSLELLMQYICDILAHI